MPSTTMFADRFSDGSQPSDTPVRQPACLDNLTRRLQIAGVEPVLPGGSKVLDATVLGKVVTDDEWEQLWQRSDETMVALADFVVPQCPLLSAEPATAVETPLGLQVPAGSAWVSMRVDLPRFARQGGQLDEDALHAALETCVDVGDAIHDIIHWPTPDQRYDAWLNRRLAVMITGIGDLAAVANADPCCHNNLRRLNQLVLGVRRSLHSRSQAIAQQCDPLPAITLSDPSHRLPAGSIRDDWHRRWRQAVRASLVRHRNLLVLSPWSLFPADRPADLCYAEFLPLLRHADAVAFDKTVSTAHWNLNEFKRFCQRTQAVLQQRAATSLIAEHV